MKCEDSSIWLIETKEEYEESFSDWNLGRYEYVHGEPLSFPAVMFNWEDNCGCSYTDNYIFVSLEHFEPGKIPTWKQCNEEG